MLRLHFSNRIEVLAQRLLGALAQSAGASDPFSVDELIVPSAGMRRWLQLALARQCGLCANLRTPFLAQWLWQLPGAGHAGDTDTAGESPFAPAVLGWRVYAALGEADWVAAHPRLAHYLGQADPVMRWELACSVAVLIEQYTSWRPDWLQAWSAGRLVLPAHPDEAWQAALWRRLAAELELPARHPVAAFAETLAAGAAGPARAGLPAAVHVFAPAAMPPLHQQLLAQLGRVIDVDVYILNPCREYWFDLVDRRRLAHLAARNRAAGHEEGNPLLTAWGQQTQALVAGLVELSGDEVLDDGDYRPHPGSSLLAQLQNALLDLQPIEPGAFTLAPQDRSLEVHVCHSRTRELEVLHDRLLALFAEDPTLQADDVLVVLPDLEAAAPLVEAVFGSVPAPRRIPFGLSGRARSGVSAPARILLALLDLLASRLPVSAVFALLQQPLVAQRFALSEDDLSQIHDWLHAAGVHWALNGAQRGQFEVPGLERHSLADGLARLFLGYALPAGADQPLAGLLPAADIAGTQAELLGRLWQYVQAIDHWYGQLTGTLPAAEFCQRLQAAAADFMAAEGEDRVELRELQATLSQLADDVDRSGLREPLPLPVLRQALQQRLDEPARGGVPGGSVTFTSLSSLRGLPYRVVCVLGLDDGLFPGSSRAAEFDLLSAQPRRGDRQRRLDERNLFLDLLLAARSHLHLSHTGRSVRDNARLPPSVLLSELLDLLLPAIAVPAAPGSAAANTQDRLAAARARLVVEHPLQPFSPRAFEPDGDRRLRSHDQGLAQALNAAAAARLESARSAADPAAGAAAAAFAPPAVGAGNADAAAHANDTADTADAANTADAPDADVADDDDVGHDGAPFADPSTQSPFFDRPLPPPEASWRTLTTEDLFGFFAQPCRALLRRRLGIDLAWDEQELADDEPLLADERSASALAQRLLPTLLRSAPTEPSDHLLQQVEAGTDWPTGLLGRVQFERALPALHALAQRLHAHLATPALEPLVGELEFDLEGERWTLRATLAGLRPHGQWLWRAHTLRARDRLHAWIQHLALCALTRTPPAPTTIAPAVQPRTCWLALDQTLAFQPVANAQAELATLLRLYRQGLRQPLHFYPRSAWTFVHSGQSLQRTRQVWTPSRTHPHAEGADAAYRLALRGCSQPLDLAFEALAHTVYDPLIEHLETDPGA